MQRARRDDGVVLVFAALTLVALLGLSAFAIDVGAVYSARRQDQTAADSAVLAAASPQVVGNTQVMLDEVLVRLNSNLDENFTLADLNTCDDDPARLPVVASVGGSSYNCVSFTSNRTALRVQVPPREYKTAFAHLIGVDTMEHGAFAIAGTKRPSFGGVLPFGVTAGSGSGHICLKSGPSGLAIEPCDGATSGNFGFLDFAHFGNAALGTPVGCNAGTGRIAANTAMGVDHDLSIWNGPPWGGEIVEDTGSPCASKTSPNAAKTATGNMPNILGDGLFSGSNFWDGQPARLQRRSDNPPPYFQWTNFGSYSLDDTPLWAFIDPSLSVADDVPVSCLQSQFVAPGGGLGGTAMSSIPTAVANHINATAPGTNERMRLLLERCFAHFESGSWTHNGFTEAASGCASYPCADPVFARVTEEGMADIQQTPRFGYVPELVETTFPNGTATVRFARFRAIFIQRVCIGQPCSIEFDPGVGAGGSSSDTRSTGFTAFAFPDTMLPFGLGSKNAPMNPANTPVRLLR